MEDEVWEEKFRELTLKLERIQGEFVPGASKLRS